MSYLGRFSNGLVCGVSGVSADESFSLIPKLVVSNGDKLINMSKKLRFDDVLSDLMSL